MIILNKIKLIIIKNIKKINNLNYEFQNKLKQF